VDLETKFDVQGDHTKC